MRSQQQSFVFGECWLLGGECNNEGCWLGIEQDIMAREAGCHLDGPAVLAVGNCVCINLHGLSSDQSKLSGL